jgi:hypothetical protein
MFFGAFGRLTIFDGFLRVNFFNNSNLLPISAIEIDGNRAFGYNWELELNDGFEISEQPNGNFTVSRT